MAIVAGFLLPLAGLVFVDSEVGRFVTADITKVWGLFAGGAAIVALGVFDDIYGANAKQKFLVQFAVAAVGTFIAAYLNGNVLMMLFMCAVSGSLLSFLVFNFNPARIFMGDTGSMFLGYILAVTSVQTSTKGAATVAFLIPVLAVGLPIIDTFLAMGRRAYRGRPMFAADKEHLHHQLLALGLSHRQAVLVLWGMAALLGIAALGLATASCIPGWSLPKSQRPCHPPRSYAWRSLLSPQLRTSWRPRNWPP